MWREDQGERVREQVSSFGTHHARLRQAIGPDHLPFPFSFLPDGLSDTGNSSLVVHADPASASPFRHVSRIGSQRQPTNPLIFEAGIEVTRAGAATRVEEKEKGEDRQDYKTKGPGVLYISPFFLALNERTCFGNRYSSI
jgi:hypothetical protein